MCSDLYAQTGAVTAPLFAYNHVRATLTAGPLPAGRAAARPSPASRSTRAPTGGTVAYPTKYDGALFFVDYARNCIGALLPGGERRARPDDAWRSSRTGMGRPTGRPSTTGPGGDLYYVDHRRRPA